MRICKKMVMAYLSATLALAVGCSKSDSMDDSSGLDSLSSTSWEYSNNARIEGDFFYLRDAAGNTIPGRRVDDGDNVTVLDVGYTKQLVLVQYPVPSGTNRGYIKNVPSLIKYFYQGQWQNNGSARDVYDENGNTIGSLGAFEIATPLYEHSSNGMFHVVYNTDKGVNTKSGYVTYHGDFPLWNDTPVAPPVAIARMEGLINFIVSLDPYQFIAFAEHMGMTPSEFRQHQQSFPDERAHSLIRNVQLEWNFATENEAKLAQNLIELTYHTLHRLTVHGNSSGTKLTDSAVLNTVIDATIGSIPALGIFWTAHQDAVFTYNTDPDRMSKLIDFMVAFGFTIADVTVPGAVFTILWNNTMNLSDVNAIQYWSQTYEVNGESHKYYQMVSLEP